MLFYLLGIPAALTTIGAFLIWPALSKWWILPILLGSFVLWNLLYVLYVWIICKRVDMSEPCPEIDPFYRTNTLIFIDWLLAVCGVKTKVVGRELLPEGEFLLVSNHRSGFDPLTTMSAFKDRKLAFISKPENIYKLFLGAAAWRSCFLPIDRENARNALKTINEAADRMKRHVCSYGIYPEGTRSKTGNLQPFHHGSYKAAQKAHVPVVIMATEGSEKAIRGMCFHPMTVTLTILEVVDADTVKSGKTSWLAGRTEQLLLAQLGH